jgi:hypothetical protein
MSNTPDKPDLRFAVAVKKSTDWRHDIFTAHVQYMITPERNDNSGLRSPCTWDRAPLAGLAELQIRAQRTPDEDKWYGFDFEYRDVFRADLKRAEVMVKQLRSVNRKLDKLTERFGYANNLADYCARCAAVIGVTSRSPFGIWSKELTYNGTNYRWVDVEGLRHWLDKPAEL